MLKMDFCVYNWETIIFIKSLFQSRKNINTRKTVNFLYIFLFLAFSISDFNISDTWWISQFFVREVYTSERKFSIFHLVLRIIRDTQFFAKSVLQIRCYNFDELLLIHILYCWYIIFDFQTSIDNWKSNLKTSKYYARWKKNIK